MFTNGNKSGQRVSRDVHPVAQTASRHHDPAPLPGPRPPSREQTVRFRNPVLSAALVTIAIIGTAAPAFAGDLPLRPDDRLTPGAVMTDDPAIVCTPGYTKTVRHTSGRLKAQIYRAYGIDKQSGHFEIDHRVPLELGGADVAENLWPESYDTQPWNAHTKDRLENFLHAEVCSGHMSLRNAQAEFQGDWIASYQHRFGEPR
jgi:hypothetical protein